MSPHAPDDASFAGMPLARLTANLAAVGRRRYIASKAAVPFGTRTRTTWPAAPRGGAPTGPPFGRQGRGPWAL